MRPLQARLRVGEILYDPPNMSIKVGQGPRDMRMSGRIVGVRSTEQSVLSSFCTF